MKVREVVEGITSGVVRVYSDDVLVEALAHNIDKRFEKFMDMQVVDVTYSGGNTRIEVAEEGNEKEYIFHHSALTRGYVSKNVPAGIFNKYRGKFGTGYTLRKHNPDSTMYCIVEYWVEKQKSDNDTNGMYKEYEFRVKYIEEELGEDEVRKTRYKVKALNVNDAWKKVVEEINERVFKIKTISMELDEK